MTETTTAGDQEQNKAHKHEMARKLDAAGWGLFFIWVGIALLADFGWGVGLLGVGIITLGEQVARKYFGLNIESFWLIAGLVFVLGGIWELSAIKLSIVPVLLIVAGIALFASVFSDKLRKK